MSHRTARVRVRLPQATKARLDHHAGRQGVARGRILEDAILYYLNGLDQIPERYLVPRRILVDRETGERLLKRIEEST